MRETHSRSFTRQRLTALIGKLAITLVVSGIVTAGCATNHRATIETGIQRDIATATFDKSCPRLYQEWNDASERLTEASGWCMTYHKEEYVECMESPTHRQIKRDVEYWRARYARGSG